MTRVASLIVVLAALSACGTTDTAPEPVSVVDLSQAAAEPLPVSSMPEPVFDSDTELEPSLELPVADEALVATSSEEIPAGRYFILRRGETLAHFARWSELPVEEIAALSELPLTGTYPVGTDVFVPLSGDALAAVESRREAHREVRVEGYLASRGGSLGSDFYSVRTGDTAWNIARTAHGIPVWLLEAYNPSVDLDRLYPGQELLVPVLGDVVVDAGEGTE